MNARPYAQQMQRVLASVASRVDPSIHPLLAVARAAARQPDAASSSSPATRGCAAASTPTSSRPPARSSSRSPDAGHARAGRPQGARLLRPPRLRRDVRADRHLPEAALRGCAGDRADWRSTRSSPAQVDRVMLVYNEFKSVMTQRVVVDQLLPIAAPTSKRRRRRAERRRDSAQIDYLYEPAPQEIFNQLLPRYVEVQVYRALLESNAAFFAAQMTAMDTATQELGGDDRQPDALHEQGAPGGDHARNHRSGLGRAGAVATDVESGTGRSTWLTNRQDRQDRPDHRAGRRRRVRGRASAGDLQRAAHRVGRQGGGASDRRHRRSRAAPRREPRPRGGDEADRRHAARHDRRPISASRSRCRSARKRSAAC